jgi:hypothetical protein
MAVTTKELANSTASSREVTSRPPSILSEKAPPAAMSNLDPEKAAAPAPAPPYSAFSHRRQMCIVLIVTAAGFFSPLTGAVYLPSLILFEKVFNTSSTVINASVSVYWAVFGIAPMFGATLSDYGGRKTIYVTSLAVFLVANSLLAALPPTVGGLFTLRVFQVGQAKLLILTSLTSSRQLALPWSHPLEQELSPMLLNPPNVLLG